MFKTLIFTFEIIKKIMKKTSFIKNGFAMFSMFFGAGNVVFPLIMGKSAGSNLWMANFGLLFSGICLPFLGLITIIFYKGDLKRFFFAFGRPLGLFLMFLVVALIGPLGGIPRCMLICYSSIQFFYPSLSLFLFAPILGLILYFSCVCRERILGLLGAFLTPVLILSLSILVVKGLSNGAHLPPVSLSWDGFFLGLKQGYFTMDLLGGFFFCSLFCKQIHQQDIENPLRHLLKSAFLGAALLAIVYGAFSILSAQYASQLAMVSPDQYLALLGTIVIGAHGGGVVAVIVSLACLTTAVALIAASANFLESLNIQSFSYKMCLSIVVALSCVVALLRFETLLVLLSPILECIYPLLIVMTLYNVYRLTRTYRSEEILN